MTTNLLFAIGTLATWIGVVLLFCTLYLAINRRPGVGPAAAASAVSLLVGALSPSLDHRLGLPLVWLVMPFAAWGAFACFGMAVFRAINALMDRDPKRWGAAAIWLGVAALFLLLYRHDPDNHIEILKGKLALTMSSLLAVVACAIAGFVAMRFAGRRGGRIGVHLALVAGSVVFGLPFVWLLVTSFKEDRDMSSRNGIVWIPRVQRTVPFDDPNDPLLAGEYKGTRVQATREAINSDGSYMVEVQRPSSLRGVTFTAASSAFREIPRDAPVVSGSGFTGFVIQEHDNGTRTVRFLTPPEKRGKDQTFLATQLEPVRDVGLRTQNYVEALEAMPPETRNGLVYLKNSVILVVMSVIGTLLSSSIVAFGFARLAFPGRELLFKILLATMMLPGAVTLMPQFLLFRSLGWVNTLLPLWVPAFFASAFNVFLLRQFFMQVPSELDDASKIDGAGVLRTFWSIMLPQIRPALAVVAIWTFMGAWNNFMGPLIYVNTPENMPLSYALQLFQGERGGEPGLMMAFATMTLLPVLLLFFFAQRYFIEGVSLSGLGGR